MAEWYELSRVYFHRNDRLRCIDALVRMAEVACHVLLEYHEVPPFEVGDDGDMIQEEDFSSHPIRLGFGSKIDKLWDHLVQEGIEEENRSLVKSLMSMKEIRNEHFHKHTPVGSIPGEKAIGIAKDLVSCMKAKNVIPAFEKTKKKQMWLRFDRASRRMWCVVPCYGGPECVTAAMPASSEGRSRRKLRLLVLGESFSFDGTDGFNKLFLACRCHNWTMDVLRAALAAVSGVDADVLRSNPVEVLCRFLEGADASVDALRGRIRAALGLLADFRKIRNKFQHELRYKVLEEVIKMADGALSSLFAFHQALELDDWSMTVRGNPMLETPFGDFPLGRPWLVKEGQTIWVVDPRRPDWFFSRNGETMTGQDLRDRLRRGPMENLLGKELEKIEGEVKKRRASLPPIE